MSSGYRHKTSEPYAEFIIRDRGVGNYPALNIEVESTFNEDFVNALKTELRHGSERSWDPELKRWFISPVALELACKVAGQFFRHVYLCEGDKTSDIISGQTWEQTGLFA